MAADRSAMLIHAADILLEEMPPEQQGELQGLQEEMLIITMLSQAVTKMIPLLCPCFPVSLRMPLLTVLPKTIPMTSRRMPADSAATTQMV